MENNTIEEELRKRYEELELEDEEEETTVRVPMRLNDTQDLQEFFYVGILYSERGINEVAFRRTLSSVWQPRYGVNIKTIALNRYLITFFHQYDYDKVWAGSPWNFNNKLLALAPRKPEENPDAITATSVPIWLQAFGIPAGYVSIRVCEAIGHYAGKFMEADANNFKVSRPLYLRIRISIDPAKPLKRKMKLRINDSNHVAVEFQYEHLPTICLICGMFQHTEVTCPLNYLKEGKPKRMYEPSIWATIRKNMITEDDKWLRDENGCSLVPTGSSSKLFGREEMHRNIQQLKVQRINMEKEDDMETDIAITDPKRKRGMVGFSGTKGGSSNTTSSVSDASSEDRARQAQ